MSTTNRTSPTSPIPDLRLPAPSSSPPAPKPGRGRPRALDHLKTRHVIHLLSRGCSLEEAARYVGCAAGTIRREARRNPEFGNELRHVRLEAELSVLDTVRHAAHGHWRAGRYLLERAAAQRSLEQNRQPLTRRRLRRFTDAITDALKSEIRDDAECQRLTTRLIEVMRETNRNWANTLTKKSRHQAQTDTHTNERAENDSLTLEQAVPKNPFTNNSTGRQTATSTSKYGKITHYASLADAARAAANFQHQPPTGAQQ
jgi:IS30 family transposase